MSTGKKILYLITQTHYGGAQKYVHDLALELNKTSGNEIAVAVGEGPLAAWLDDLDKAGIPVIRLKHVKRDLSLWHDLLSSFELLSLFNKIRPTVIHLNSSKIGAIGAAVAAIYKLYLQLKAYSLRLLVVYTVHGFVLNEPLSLWRKVYCRFAEWFGSFFKDAIICVSDYDRQSLLRWRTSSPNKLHVIHNGIDINNLRFLPKPEAQQKIFEVAHPPLALPSIRGRETTGLEPGAVPAWRQAGTQWELPGNRDEGVMDTPGFLIGSIAGLYKTKGLEYFIQAARLVLDGLTGDAKLHGDSIIFFVIGSGPEQEKLRDLIGKLRLREHFFLAGQLENAAQYLKAFDIFVLPSIKEGLAYTLIEARAAGLPIIATSVGGNPEIITDKQTGLLVPPAGPQSLAGGILKLLSDKTLRERLGEAAAQNLGGFNLPSMAQKTMAIYRSHPLE